MCCYNMYPYVPTVCIYDVKLLQTLILLHKQSTDSVGILVVHNGNRRKNCENNLIEHVPKNLFDLKNSLRSSFNAPMSIVSSIKSLSIGYPYFYAAEDTPTSCSVCLQPSYVK